VATPIISSLPHHTAATQSTYKVLPAVYSYAAGLGAKIV
jgi:hypothetical protein